MPVRRVLANAGVSADAGRAAIQRGPIVYAVEGVDNGDRVFDLVVPDAAALTVEFQPDLLKGVAVITGPAVEVSKNANGKIVETPRLFQAIPYYAWANRGPGQMLVWLPRTAAAVKPPKRLDMRVD